jgi:PBSX family phage terminase large subunit
MNEIILNKKYEPLFRDYKEVRTVLLAGSRGSGKSFAGSLWLTNSFNNSHKNALYLRKYATNIEASVIPQFLSQVDCLKLKFNIKKNSIENQNEKKLYFMGIESSQSTADSKLKSIPNLERVLIEEATEITEEEYNKLNLSIRDKDSQPKIVLTFNPSYEEHWIYKRFYEQRNIAYDFNGVKDGVLYIHTTYLDNINNLDETFLKEAEATKKYDPIKYARDFEGKWLKETEKSFLTQQLLELAIQNVEEPNEYEQIVVAVDPAVTTNKNSDATGIAVAGKKGNHYYVLHVEENKWTPEQWSTKAKELYDKYNANFIVYESNQGGDMVEHTLRNVLGNFVRIKSVRATQGKLIRFEPVLALYEQQLVHHLGRFHDLEYQLLTYSGSAKDSSPNCVDAEVWAITSLNQSGTSCYTFA